MRDNILIESGIVMIIIGALAYLQVTLEAKMLSEKQTQKDVYCEVRK